jgi:hypothetical protein
MAGRRNTDTVETITFWIVGAGLAVIPFLVFFFSFGNVGAFGESLGVEHRIAYLTGPAVDLAVVVLVVASSYLAMRETERGLWPLHLAAFTCGMIMISLNTEGAVYAHHWRLAAFDSVGPVMLIGWGSLAPWLWRNLTEVRRAATGRGAGRQRTSVSAPATATASGNGAATSPASSAAPAAAAAPATGGNVLPFAAAPGRRSAADWAVIALPLWTRHVDATRAEPTAKELAALLRHEHPGLGVPSSDRSERNIRAATGELAAAEQRKAAG